MSNAKYYIDKDELWSEIKSYYEKDDESIAKGNGSIVMPDKLGNMLMSIAEKIMTSRSFSGYPYNDQMIGDAIIRMVKILSEKKFNLYSNMSVPLYEDVEFRGYLDIQEEHIPEGGLEIVRGFEKVKNKLTEVFYRMEALKDRYIKDPKTGEFKQAYVKTYEVKAKIVPSKTETTRVKCFVETGKKRNGGVIVQEVPIYEKDENGEYKIIKFRSNAFGYLSLISNREAINRIKKEGRNFRAINKFQEETFTKFLIDNPEMQPQRIDDDTYDSFLNNEYKN